MVKITKEAALAYHSMGKPGKIEVVPTKPYSTQTDLSLAYSPGVATPCTFGSTSDLTRYYFVGRNRWVVGKSCYGLHPFQLAL